MRVAVLMSTYNGEKYIKEQIDSILAQEGDFQLDLWVRDDGSKDGTKAILDEYGSRLNWYTGENLGPAHSFLDLVKQCEGYDLYAFADQDDYWKAGKIAKAVACLKESSIASVYFANAELVDSNLQSLGRNVYRQTPKIDLETLSCAGGVLGCTMVFNSSLAKYIQECEMPGPIVMHDFYVCELCLAIGGEIIFDEQAQMLYRQHGNNVVGVSSGKLQTIKNRLCDITKKNKVSIAQQAFEIVKLYGNVINEDKKDWMQKVSGYTQQMTSRVALAFSGKTRFINRNMGLKIRLSILLGNR